MLCRVMQGIIGLRFFGSDPFKERVAIYTYLHTGILCFMGKYRVGYRD